MIRVYRASISPPGSALFDSDIRHQHTMFVEISYARRQRDLNHDWIHAGKEIIEVEMSEAQWASFVSSPNSSGVPCTLRVLQGETVERVPYAPRLAESMKETHAAAERAFKEIRVALEAYEAADGAKAKREALGGLRAAINNATPNVDFAAKSLGEHAENVVSRARADIEAMVRHHADQLGIEAPETVLQLERGNEVE
jgi:hypothetical protein